MGECGQPIAAGVLMFQVVSYHLTDFNQVLIRFIIWLVKIVSRMLNLYSLSMKRYRLFCRLQVLCACLILRL